jgi:hypothetical protein
LLPLRLQYDLLREIAPSVEVILSRGPWPAQNRPDALEFMFEDATINPYCLQTIPDQWDRLPDQTATQATWQLAIWIMDQGRVKRVRQLPLRYRLVDHLPWAKAWGDKK